MDEFAEIKNNDELQMKLRIKFVNDNQNKCAEIIEAIATGDMTLAHRLVHTLKGNAGQIGKTALQNIAADVEASLKEGKEPDAKQMEIFESELNIVLEGLRPLLKTAATRSETLDLPAEQAMALFERLQPMLEDFNAECLTLIDEIRAVPGSEELARQIEDYDFESAAVTLSELKRGLE
jgi:HPt (histidine-containing phosphotransfer) domain-containing protein